MKKYLILAALAVPGLSISTAALAQQQGSILVVDSDRILNECTACKSAATQVQQKQSAARARAQQLQTQLETEGKPLQAIIDALPSGKQPDAALKAKITAFQTKERSAQQELSTAQTTLQSTVANVQQQIGVKLIGIVEQVRARRGAAVVLAKNSTIANDSALDVTTEVLTSLNQQLPSVSVTPLPQQPQQQQPQGR
jgi:Skp family chaperone for outer membrane proteins